MPPNLPTGHLTPFIDLANCDIAEASVRSGSRAELPTELGNLESLTSYFDIQGNWLTGALPVR